MLGLEIDDEDVDTIGGWILTENYEAKEGDILHFEQYTFKIQEMEEHHIKYVEITKNSPADETGTAGETNYIDDTGESVHQFPLAKSEVLS